ncbi:MAG: hypothetical protein JWQ29_2109 [Phenylobacterium sp.]|nr:hypothetical protein [Phenylobacterium sp.]
MRWLAGFAALLLGGCSHYEPLSLHGAASMRVEVEVYKGPLTVPAPGQVGELVGVLSDSVHATYEWRQKAMQVPCGDGSGPDCLALQSALNTSGDIIDASCYIMETPTLTYSVGASVYIPLGTCKAFDNESKLSLVNSTNTTRDVRGTSSSPPNSYETRLSSYKEDLKSYEEKITAYEKAVADYEKEIASGKRAAISTENPSVDPAEHLSRRELFFPGLKSKAESCIAASSDLFTQLKCQGPVISVAADNLSAILRGAARRALDANLSSIPRDAKVRGLLVEYAAMTAEYGEQIHSRITVLQKQFNDPDGLREPRTLPVSDYLRDAGRTDYIQLFDWLKGSVPGPLSPAERIRMAQRLTADSYWQRVNEVYASGQGEVAMAFIKDDLGNWDLKSFSNDPSELLAAYRKVTDAALKTAVDLTRKAATGPAGAAVERLSSAQKAAGLANQLATGEVPGTAATVGGANIATLHERTAGRMAAQKVRFETQEQKLQAEITAKAKVLADLAAARPALDQALTNATQALALKTQTLADANAALTAAKNDGTDTVGPQAAVNAAQADVTLAGPVVTQATAEVAANAKGQAEATLAKTVAEKRLADLPADAVDAVRATLDDHLAVVAALQDGITAKPAEPTTRQVPTGLPLR